MANPYTEKFNVEAPAGKEGEGTPGAKEGIKGIGNASGANVEPKENVASTDRCVTSESLDSIRGWKPPHRR